MFSCPEELESRSMPSPHLLVLHRLFDTTHHHRYCHGLSDNASHLESPNASITKSDLEFHFWCGRLVSFLLLQHWSTLTTLSSDFGVLTEFCIFCSVTIVAFVRLVYLVKANAESDKATTNLSNIVIWTGVEVNMSLVCGQYKPSSGIHRSL